MKIVAGDRGQAHGNISVENREVRNHLLEFYNGHFGVIDDNTEIGYQNLSQIMKYEAKKIKTMYENNIEANFIKYIKRYVNVRFQKKIMMDHFNDVGDLNGKREFIEQLNLIKSDILCVDGSPFRANERHHLFILHAKNTILPSNHVFQEQSVYYDIKCSPLLYLNGMILISGELENANEYMYHTFPLRTSIIPGHITLDSSSIIDILMSPPWVRDNLPGPKKILSDNITLNNAVIWSHFFRINRKCFRKVGHTFHFMIDTDGMSCAIKFHETSEEELRGVIIKKRKRQSKKRTDTQLLRNENYIDALDVALSMSNYKQKSS